MYFNSTGITELGDTLIKHSLTPAVLQQFQCKFNFAEEVCDAMFNWRPEFNQYRTRINKHQLGA